MSSATEAIRSARDTYQRLDAAARTRPVHRDPGLPLRAVPGASRV